MTEERKKPPRPLWRSTLLLGLVIAALLAAKKLKETPNPTIPLVAAADTTWFVAPAREDGTVDYARALAAERGDAAVRGNAAPALAQALGRETSWASAEERAELSPLERPFVGLDEWITAGIGDASVLAAIEARARAEAALAELERGELGGADAPLVRDWLADVGGALDRAAAAAELAAFRVPAPNGLFDRPFRAASIAPLVRALAARAIVAAADGRGDAALADLRAALRLARIVEAPGTLVDRASAEERALVAWRAALAIAGSERGSSVPCAELVGLASREPLAEQLAAGLLGHRIEALDLLAGVYRGEAADRAADAVLAMARDGGGDPARAAERAEAERSRFRAAAGFAGLDPNRVFRRFNEQWDRVESLLLDRATSWDERLERLAALRRAIEQIANHPPKSTLPYTRWMTSRETRAAQLADQFMTRVLPRAARALAEWLAAAEEVDRAVARLAASAGVAAWERERP